MWAFARVDLGLADSEFWSLTPAQFFALSDEVKETMKREDYRFGLLTMLIRNVAGDSKAEVFDYFPQHKEAGARSSRNPTPSEVRARMRAYVAQQKNNGASDGG